ncbi:MAG TPA: adenylate/guanylate cyclase domain-containing protein [Tepidisphaeraceae bacterium]|nr:adenylate/guanylate cyclase domain-containing protein [Tepidisphaeraceae bacterium]
MNRTEKKLFKRTVQLGLVLTLAVILCDCFGLLDRFERFIYDRRAQYCQFFTPPPTDKIVHLDIDDEALQDIGSFPWPRTKLAEMVDELHRAGAKVIGFDIIFPEAQPPRYEPDAEGKIQTIQDDQNFADAIRRAGNVLIPLSVQPQSPDRPAVLDPLVAALKSDLEMDQNQAIAKLRGTRVDTPQLDVQVKANFFIAREQAMFDRISEQLEKDQSDIEQLRQMLTPHAYPSGEQTDVVKLLITMLPSVQATQRLTRFTLPIQPGLPPILRGDQARATIAALADATTYCGTADFIEESDGIVRSVPLFVNYRGRLIPHMSFAAALAMLDIKLADLKIDASSVTLPMHDGSTLRIPVRSIRSERFGKVGMFMSIPWFGASGLDSWLAMYDWPRHVQSKQHLSLRNVWDIRQNLRDIERNKRETDSALFAVNGPYPSARITAFLALLVSQRDDATRSNLVETTLKDMADLADIPALQKSKPGELKEDDQKYLATYLALRHVQEVNQHFFELVQNRRAELKRMLEGRYALVGWTATGTGDFKPTSLHPSIPGDVIQGVIDNAIFNRDVWRFGPWILAALCTAIVGVLTSLAVALLSAPAAAACTAILLLGYLAINGIVFFDYGNWIVGAAGPLTAGAVVWTALTLFRYIDETRERRRITDRFSSYVDPVLVDFVVNNPETARFDGLEKEMTVVFTDLAGFTTISEKLRERTVPLLNEYMSLMLPIIRENRGYWNKFLGDGIMFFYNAPANNPRHAPDAVRTILQMQKAIEGFNQTLFKRDLPAVGMRAGIATGLMVVGDAGSTDAKHHASDYTVLGDEVNLGARLESANKSFESRMLMTARTAELLDSEFLLRPIGKLQVMGKTQGVMTFEAICLQNEAQDRDKKIAEGSTRVVNQFLAAKFDQCVQAAKNLERDCGPSKFTKLYHKLAQHYLEESPKDFNGVIVLDAK